MPKIRTNATKNIAKIEIKVLIFLTFTCKGVIGSSFLFKELAIFPISVDIPVFVTTATIFPVTRLVPAKIILLIS